MMKKRRRLIWLTELKTDVAAVRASLEGATEILTPGGARRVDLVAVRAVARVRGEGGRDSR